MGDGLFLLKILLLFRYSSASSMSEVLVSYESHAVAVFRSLIQQLYIQSLFSDGDVNFISLRGRQQLEKSLLSLSDLYERVCEQGAAFVGSANVDVEAERIDRLHEAFSKLKEVWHLLDVLAFSSSYVLSIAFAHWLQVTISCSRAPRIIVLNSAVFRNALFPQFLSPVWMLSLFTTLDQKNILNIGKLLPI